MLKSYEAIYDHGKIEWLSEFPDVEQARVIVTLLPEQPIYSEKPKRCDGTFPDVATNTRLSDSQASSLLAETAGAWGNRSLPDIDAMLAEQRRQDWGD